MNYQRMAEELASAIKDSLGGDPHGNATEWNQDTVTALIATALQAAADTAREWQPIETAHEAGDASFLVSDGEQVWTTFFIEGTNKLATDNYGWKPKWWMHKPAPPAPHTPRTAQQSEAVIAAAMGKHLTVVKEGR